MANHPKEATPMTQTMMLDWQPGIFGQDVAFVAVRVGVHGRRRERTLKVSHLLATGLFLVEEFRGNEGAPFWSATAETECDAIALVNQREALADPRMSAARLAWFVCGTLAEHDPAQLRAAVEFIDRHGADSLWEVV
jgi:hypothetical protein